MSKTRFETFALAIAALAITFYETAAGTGEALIKNDIDLLSLDRAPSFCWKKSASL